MKRIKYNQKLKGRIQEQGLKNSWLSNQLNVDPAMITNWITGKRTPAITQKSILANLLHCEIADIFEDI